MLLKPLNLCSDELLMLDSLRPRSVIARRSLCSQFDEMCVGLTVGVTFDACIMGFDST